MSTQMWSSRWNDSASLRILFIYITYVHHVTFILKTCAISASASVSICLILSTRTYCASALWIIWFIMHLPAISASNWNCFTASLIVLIENTLRGLVVSDNLNSAFLTELKSISILILNEIVTSVWYWFCSCWMYNFCLYLIEGL